jgi:hypothetical protein
MKRPYDLATLDPLELEALLLKRPDLRKEIFEEANRRIGIAAAEDLATLWGLQYDSK